MILVKANKDLFDGEVPEGTIMQVITTMEDFWLVDLDSNSLHPVNKVDAVEVTELNADYDDRVIMARIRKLAEGFSEVYDTNELTTLYDVQGFLAPFCVATNRRTGQKVTFEFQHSPRIYWRVQ